MVNTITAVHVAQQNQKKEEQQKPRQWAIILHAKRIEPPFTPSRRLEITVHMVAHVLVDHLFIERELAVTMTTQAFKVGKAVIKLVSRDIGETLMADINSCASTSNPDFSFKLEQL